MGILNPDDAGFVIQQRIDYVCFIEALGELPPVAFETRAHLEKWYSDKFNARSIQPIKGGKNAIRVELKHPSFTFMEQI